MPGSGSTTGDTRDDKTRQFAGKMFRLQRVAGRGWQNMLHHWIVVAADQRNILRDTDSPAVKPTQGSDKMGGVKNEKAGGIPGRGEKTLKAETDAFDRAIVDK